MKPPTIEYFTEEVETPKIETSHFEEITSKILQEHSRNVEKITIIFCSDEYLLRLNKEYLSHDYYTDIITFEYSNKTEYSGDLFISLDRVEENAKIFHKTYENELYRVMLHGILHLVGYNDKTEREKQQMKEKENNYLTLIEEKLTHRANLQNNL